MPQIIITGVGIDSPAVVLPMDATKTEIVEALLSTSGEPDKRRYTISRDGLALSTHDTHNEAFTQLHRIQGQSVDWAIKYGGYAITETEGTEQ